jgi:hypothetical protein
MSYDDLQKELEQLVREYESKRMQNEFLFEKRLVEREVKDGIVREWNWVDGGERIEIDKTKKYEVIVPAHRLDVASSKGNSLLSNMKGKLVMVYLNFSGQMSKVHYTAWNSASRACYAKDPLLEYRLPIILKYYKMKNEGNNLNDIVGLIYDEFYSGKRMGYYKSGTLSLHKGNEGYEEELLVTKYKNSDSKYDYSRDTKKQLYDENGWKKIFENFDKALLERVEKMAPKMVKQGSVQKNVSIVTYEATPSEEKCEKCVYRELCQIPRVEGFGC